MGSVAALMGSIKSHGLLNPITVRPMKGGRYQVVCGYRRFSAIAALGWKRVPAIVRPDLAENDRLVYELIIAENEQRRTLTPLEEGRFFWEFSARFYERNMSLALSELARISGLSESTVSRRRALMLLPQELAALLETGELSLGDAEGFAQSVAKGFVSKQAMSELLGALPELKNRGNLVAILRAASLGPEALTLALHPKSSAMRTTPAAAATESGPRIQEAPHVYTAPAPAPYSDSGSAPPAAPPDQGAREVHPAPGTVPPGGLQEKRSRWSLDDWIPVGVLDNEFYCECGRGYVAVSSRRLILRKKDVADSAQNGKGER
jgi:ParB/RepB/Spo0J family partition protein